MEESNTAIPGTVTLVDVNHDIAARHLEHGDTDVILVPTPSSDPNDPLNWSRRRKLLATVCVSLYALKSSNPSLISSDTETKSQLTVSKGSADSSTDILSSSAWPGRCYTRCWFRCLKNAEYQLQR
jgi:hypothetical protein